MKTRSLFAGAAVLLAIVAAYSLFAGGDDHSPPPLDAAAAATPAPVVQAAPSAELERRVLESGRASEFDPAANTGSSPAADSVPRWAARFLVVDWEGAPVADAVVTVSAASDRKKTHVLFELRTDLAGRAEVALESRHAVAEARKEGLGSTGEQDVRRDAEITLRLEVPATQRGLVLHADGRPAGGAKVSAVPTNSSRSDRVPTPPTVTTGGDGRFEMQLRRQVDYILRADLGRLMSFPQAVRVTRSLPDVTLTFQGGISISGLVLEADGQPAVSARVNVRLEPRDWLRSPPNEGSTTVHTGKDGRFTAAVRTHARYQLVAAQGKRANSAISRSQLVETTAVRPHAQVHLQLQTLATIRGYVVRSSGKKVANVDVAAVPEMRAAGSAGATGDHSVPAPTAVTTNAEGAFELLVHPEATWTLIARPNRGNEHLDVRLAGVRPGDQDVVLQVNDADLAGCTVRGTVTRFDGQPVGRYRVGVVEYEAGRALPPHGPQMFFESTQFKIWPVSRGRQFGVIVLPDGDATVAPMLVGPFWADGREVQLEVRLLAWSQVPVLVLDASGAPARSVRVQLAGPAPPARRGQPEANGRLVLDQVVPGANTLCVFDDSGPVCEQEVLVQPGQNAEVVVRLPASK